jgi:hypothetical protein
MNRWDFLVSIPQLSAAVALGSHLSLGVEPERK